MNKFYKIIPFLVFSLACGNVATEDTEVSTGFQKKVPEYCYTHPVSMFLENYVPCDSKYPEYFDVCAFADNERHVDQIQVPVGDPTEAFKCQCEPTGYYFCM